MGLLDKILGSREVVTSSSIQPNTIKTADVQRNLTLDVTVPHFYNVSGEPMATFPTLYSEPNPVFITGAIPTQSYFSGSKEIQQTNRAGGCN